MWIVKFGAVFLIVWGVWWLLWTLIFAANDVLNGTAPAPIMIGVAVALFGASWFMRRKKAKTAMKRH